MNVGTPRHTSLAPEVMCRIIQPAQMPTHDYDSYIRFKQGNNDFTVL